MNKVKSLLKIKCNNLIEDISTNTTTLTVPTGIHYLSDVLTDLPKGVFIDKQVCGVGGTTLAIQSPTNYVIAVHRKILVENKYMQHPDKLIQVVGGVFEEEIIEGVRKGKNKIITTYDGLGKVANALEQLGLLGNYHLLVDEVQNVIREGGDFRVKVCNNLLENACNFASVSYLTATSTERKYLPEQIKDIPYLKIEWEDSVNIKVNQKQIKGDLTQAITSIALDHIDNPEKGEAYFFFNTVRGVIPVIKNLIKLRTVTEKDIKVICADSDDNQKVLDSIGGKWKPERPLEQDKKGNVTSNNKRITFITKTCFEGVDYYSDNPVTYIVSDAKNKKKHFVKTDIAVDIRQIAGRFRTLNPMCKQEVVLLWTGQHEGFDMSEQEYEAEVLKKIDQVKNTIDLTENGTIDGEVLETLAKTSKYYTTIDGVVVYNKLAYSNIMSEYRTQHEDFKVVIENGKEIRNLDTRLSKLYDVDTYELPELSVVDKKALGKKLNFKQAAEDYYNAVKFLESTDCSDTFEVLTNLKLACPSLVDYEDTLGIDEFRTCGFQESKLKKKFLLVVGAKELESNRSAVREVFRLKDGEWYSLKDVKSKLTKAYKQLGFQNKAFASDVSKFYVTKRSKRNGVEGVVVLDIV